MKTIDDLNASIQRLTVAVDNIPPQQPPIDLTAQVDAIDAQSARIEALNPPTP